MEEGYVYLPVVSMSQSPSSTVHSTTQYQSNSITINGGGVYVSGTYSSISIENSDFSMNTAIGSGAAVYINGSAIVTNSTFTSNTALSGEAGAIYSNGRSANVSFFNRTFSYKAGSACGVLDVDDLHHVIIFHESTFTYNTATGLVTGGGVACSHQGLIEPISP